MLVQLLGPWFFFVFIYSCMVKGGAEITRLAPGTNRNKWFCNYIKNTCYLEWIPIAHLEHATHVQNSESLSQWPRFSSSLWPLAACNPPSLSLSLCSAALIKYRQKKSPQIEKIKIKSCYLMLPKQNDYTPKISLWTQHTTCCCWDITNSGHWGNKWKKMQTARIGRIVADFQLTWLFSGNAIPNDLNMAARYILSCRLGYNLSWESTPETVWIRLGQFWCVCVWQGCPKWGRVGWS